MSATRPERLLPAGLALLLLSGLGMAAEGADYFGRNQADGAGTVLPLPGWLQAVVGQAIQLQEAFHRLLVAKVQAVGGQFAWLPFATLLALAFAYGVFHALGPGHGKAVVASYFLARRSRPWRGMVMGTAISMVQALSAIVVVTVPALILHISSHDILAGSGVLEVASYGLILGLGLYMALGVVTGRGCGHDHDEVIAFSDADEAHMHRHADNGPHVHAHDQRYHDPHRQSRLKRRGVFGAALTVGIRPCTGAILVLLFTLANGLLALGILATLVMGLGAAITISAIGIGVIGLRGSITSLAGRHAALARYAQTGLQLTGSLVIITLGGVMLLAALERGVTGPAGLFGS